MYAHNNYTTCLLTNRNFLLCDASDTLQNTLQTSSVALPIPYRKRLLSSVTVQDPTENFCKSCEPTRNFLYVLYDHLTNPIFSVEFCGTLPDIL